MGEMFQAGDEARGWAAVPAFVQNVQPVGRRERRFPPAGTLQNLADRNFFFRYAGPDEQHIIGPAFQDGLPVALHAWRGLFLKNMLSPDDVGHVGQPILAAR